MGDSRVSHRVLGNFGVPKARARSSRPPRPPHRRRQLLKLGRCLRNSRICTHIHTYIHTYICTYIHNTYLPTYLPTYIHTDIITYTHTYTHTCIRRYVRTHTMVTHARTCSELQCATLLPAIAFHSVTSQSLHLLHLICSNIDRWIDRPIDRSVGI